LLEKLRYFQFHCRSVVMAVSRLSRGKLSVKHCAKLVFCNIRRGIKGRHALVKRETDVPKGNILGGNVWIASCEFRQKWHLKRLIYIYIKAKRAGWLAGWLSTFECALLGDGGLLLCGGGVFFLVSSRSVSW
jgi:hypothetical protein